MIRAVPILILIWTGMVVYFTLSPADYLPESNLFGYDKVGHFGLFGGWTGLIGLYLVFYREKETTSLWLIWITGLLFSMLIEAAQGSLPLGRTAEWADMFANALGCTTATGIIMLLRRSRFKKYLALER